MLLLPFQAGTIVFRLRSANGPLLRCWPLLALLSCLSSGASSDAAAAACRAAANAATALSAVVNAVVYATLLVASAVNTWTSHLSLLITTKHIAPLRPCTPASTR